MGIHLDFLKISFHFFFLIREATYGHYPKLGKCRKTNRTYLKFQRRNSHTQISTIPILVLIFSKVLRVLFPPPLACLVYNRILKSCTKCFSTSWGAWVAQSVKRSTSAQVMISQFIDWEPHIRLCVDRSEPGACFEFCVSFSLCPSPLALCLSVSLSQK